jgi:hypothetical protein
VASASENRMSVLKAVLSLYFFASPAPPSRAAMGWCPHRRRTAVCSARYPSRPSASLSLHPSDGRAADASRDRTLDSNRRIGVYGDVGAPVFGGFDRGVQFRFSEGDHIYRGDATPPPAVNLICVAPCMSCSRARSRTSSGLSASMLPPICSIRLSGPPIVLGRSESCLKSP